MFSDKNLEFIKDKVSGLRNAIMYSMSNELIRLPNSIVTALKVDEMGQLWFVCEKPMGWTDDAAKSFPVSLHFYRKGVQYFMNLSGKAEIVNNAYKGPEMATKPLLIKMDILNIEYTEMEPNVKSKFQLAIERAFEWVVRHLSFPTSSKHVLEGHNSYGHS